MQAIGIMIAYTYVRSGAMLLTDLTKGMFNENSKKYKQKV